MIHKFYENTLTTRFISNFLYRYWLPTYDTVQIGDYMQKGYFYIYKMDVIKCTHSGYLGGIYKQDINQKEYWTRKAIFENVWSYHIGERFRKFTDNFVHHSSNYSSDLHERLGKFVRAYSDITGINLKPYYNCNSNRFINTLYIGQEITEESNNITYKLYDYITDKKIFIVPIRFNHTYTIALDCKSQVLMCPIFLTNGRKLLLKNIGADKQVKTIDVSTEFLTETQQVFNFPSMSFTDLKYVQVECKDDIGEKYYKYQDNLYLMIQLPSSNKSSVVVLEGKYTNSSWKNMYSLNKISQPETISPFVFNRHYTDFITTESLNNSCQSKLNLLLFNSKMQIPFSNRLLEYLYDNVIDNTWKLDTNITKVQKLLSYKYEDVYPVGIWDNYLRIELFKYAMESKNGNHIDIQGYVDRETERLLLKSTLNERNDF